MQIFSTYPNFTCKARAGFQVNHFVLKRSLLLITVFFATLFKMEAQTAAVDSVRNLFNLAISDTLKVNALATLAEIHPRGDSAIYYGLKGAELAKKIGFSSGEAVCLRNAGYVYYSSGDIVRSISMMQKSLDICTRIGDEKGIMYAIEGLAALYYTQKDFRQELKEHLKAESIARKYSIWISEVGILGNIAKTYGELNLLDSAEVYLTEAKEIIKQRIIREDIVAYVFAVEGDIQTSRENYNEAVIAWRSNLHVAEKTGNRHGQAFACSSLAAIFTKSNQMDSALYYANRGSDLVNNDPDSLETVISLNKTLSGIYEAKRNYSEALEFYKKYKRTEDSGFSHNKMNTLAGFTFHEQQRDQELAEEKRIYTEKLFRYLLLAGVLVMILIAALLYRNNINKQKAKSSLEKAYANLKTTQAQLIQSEKMASIGELMSGIAHEIQNPLNFVNNFSDVNTELIEELKSEALKGNNGEVIAIAEDIKSNEEKINHHGKRADAIVKGMLEHSRQGTGQKESTDINALSDEYLRLAYRALRGKDKSFNVTMKTDFDSSIGKINIVPQDIGRVLLNLYNNAFYAVNEKKLLAPNEGYEPTIWVSTKKTADRIVISVKDNGNGVPQKIVDKIFQPFFTTKPTGQGTGLGLSLSYDIIKAHGGEIKVVSIEGQRSEFVIQIPGLGSVQR